TAGPWAFYLWQEHGNPTFPYFNQWFQSPDALFHSHKDEKFIPHGWDAWLAPLHLLSGSRRFSESRLADPRLLLGLVALTVWWMQGWRERIGAFPAARVRLCLWVFMAASFLVWVKLYGIYRYLFALELICSVCLIGVITQWRPSRFPRTLLVVAVLVLVLIALTNPPGWGRNSFSTPMVDVRLPRVPPNALVIQANDQPLGYAAAFLPRTVPTVSIRNNFMEPTRCTRLQSRAEARIRMHEGPLYLLRELPEHPRGEEAYRAYGLSAGGACLPVYSNLSRLELCPLTRTEATPVLCSSQSPDR
ncbi:MAG TPA: hypothetical protein VEY92_10685, partial [Pseudoxanthomonas sp.]|nr:hypothetical protein [Pseudoxanthomonas sp.]